MKRIFIDSDIVQEDELRTAQRRLSLIFEKSNIPYVDNVFDGVVDFAWHEADKAWTAVKSADEIYANSSLIPLCGYGSYTGSVVVMDVMMQKAIDEDVRGKSIYFLRSYDNIEWEGIDMSLIDKAFKHNFIYTLEFNDDYKFEQVDIDKLIKRYKS